MATREELRADASLRAGMSNQELLDAGLSQTEVQTIAAGFNGAFGGGNAQSFRAGAGLTTDAQGNVVNTATTAEQQAVNNINNPQLPGNTELIPQLQTAQADEMQTAQQLTPTGASVQGVDPITGVPSLTAQTATAATTDATQALAGVDQNGAQVQSQFTQAVAPMQAVAGQVTDLATVKGQLENLFSDVQSGEVPLWAIGAYNKAQEDMASRGIGASTISAGAITAAYMQSALPIAAQDASTYFQMDMTNLANEQQAEMVNFQARQQNMLTDTAIANATEQFNASSKTQTQQFVASLISNIQEQNAARVTAVSQFNAQQENLISAENASNTRLIETANAQIQLQVQEFNANMLHQREQFNANMSFAVDQSNVLWRRSLNTANTAAVNAANQTNVQNRFNLSSTAQNQVWQAMRDERQWAFQSAENQKALDYNLAIAGMNRSLAEDQADEAMMQAIGRIGLAVATELF